MSEIFEKQKKYKSKEGQSGLRNKNNKDTEI